ncbi:flavin reductase family protein [Micromonospora sp. WMMD1120]|uniref:flavin reductase family protein n=1 Tax=Micromonospora sp. WMMD1120 TaxID=3016106 RepID=UPI002417112E|nr:flavin reductase family protein [Micromonospora sp. WMMD1120]MDG4807575.1 flavin reductase family protein [Micromonospora sp. WMMD1120]
MTTTDPPGDVDLSGGERLRSVLRHHPAGVVVVTAAGPQGPAGCTVSSFSSASLRPPLVSLCLDHASTTWAAVRHSSRLAVHLLDARHRDLAARFAGRWDDRFGPATPWHPDDDGVPWLRTGTARLRCTVHRAVDVGDHALVIADVRRIDPGEAANPLVYLTGRYGVHTPL